MGRKIIKAKDLVSKIPPGAFLRVELVSGKFIFLRKLSMLSDYVYYDFITSESVHDLSFIASQPVLLSISLSLIKDPTWPIVGHLPLEKGWPQVVRRWDEQTLPVTEEEILSGNINYKIGLFVIDFTENGPVFTPAHPEEIRGLTRYTLHTPELVESKIRLHYGLEKDGKTVKAVPLNQQPAW